MEAVTSLGDGDGRDGDINTNETVLIRVMVMMMMVAIVMVNGECNNDGESKDSRQMMVIEKKTILAMLLSCIADIREGVMGGRSGSLSG